MKAHEEPNPPAPNSQITLHSKQSLAEQRTIVPLSRLGSFRGRRGTGRFLPPQGPALEPHTGLRKRDHGVTRESAHHKAPPGPRGPRARGRDSGSRLGASNAGPHRQPPFPHTHRGLAGTGAGRVGGREGQTQARPGACGPQPPPEGHDPAGGCHPAAAGPPPSPAGGAGREREASLHHRPARRTRSTSRNGVLCRRLDISGAQPTPTGGGVANQRTAAPPLGC